MPIIVYFLFDKCSPHTQARSLWRKHIKTKQPSTHFPDYILLCSSIFIHHDTRNTNTLHQTTQLQLFSISSQTHNQNHNDQSSIHYYVSRGIKIVSRVNEPSWIGCNKWLTRFSWSGSLLILTQYKSSLLIYSVTRTRRVCTCSSTNHH